MARWPELRLKTLVLHGTRVTTACLEHLAALAELQYLDMRCFLAIYLTKWQFACGEDCIFDKKGTNFGHLCRTSQ